MKKEKSKIENFKLPANKHYFVSKEALNEMASRSRTPQITPLDTLVLTPRGWQPVEQLEKGSIISGVAGVNFEVLKVI